MSLYLVKYAAPAGGLHTTTAAVQGAATGAAHPLAVASSRSPHPPLAPASLSIGNTTEGQDNSISISTAAVGSSSFAARLAAGPRLAGQVQLNAYDAALRGIRITQHLQYEGLLPGAALEAGLAVAVAAFPVVLGWLQQQPDNSSLLLRWDTRSNSSSCSMRQRTFSWEVATVPGACPCVWSSWQLWRHAALPAAGGRLAAAKATLFPDAGQSLLQQQQQQQQLAWSIPYTRQGCLAWLQQHSSSLFFPSDAASRCAMVWKLLAAGLASQRSVWRLPRCLLQEWKAAADKACPLPPGMRHTANSAMCAVLTGTLFAADPRAAQRQGGLHVNVVVDARDGRCGMAIPAAAASNASIWAARIWLQRQLSDAAGAVNKQFEWWEAARRAGRCGQLHLCQGLPHTDAGDITFDCLRGSAWELAALPGCRLVAASLRWPCAYFNRVVMASRAPPQQQASGQPGAVAGLDGPSGGGCTGEADIQIELNMPRRGAKQLCQAWHRMGLQHICMLGATPHQQQPATCSACPPASSSGNYKAACICSWCSAPCRAGDGVWQVVEGLMCPGAAAPPLSLSLDGGATKVGHADFVSALMAMTPGEANVLAGMVMQANSFGSSYAFGKSLTEQMVADTPLKQGAFKAIVRPALISNLAGSPYPGYLQGYAGPGGYIMAAASYAMGFCQGLGSMAYGSDQVLDLIPCDTVAALVICAAAAAAAAADTAADTAQAAAAGTSGATTVYHASSSASHPLPIADAFSYMAEYWTANPPPLCLPLTKYVRFTRPHTPTAASVQQGQQKTAAKASMVAGLTRLVGEPRQAYKLQMGVKAFGVQNSIPLAASLICSVDNVVALRDSIAPQEQQLWPLLWAPGEPAGMPWHSYSFVMHSAVRQLLFGQRGAEQLHKMCCAGGFEPVAAAITAEQVGAIMHGRTVADGSGAASHKFGAHGSRVIVPEALAQMF
ncbi:hypothetical protein OEZ86_005888 [Tetradesmus obliquus]|nr:hypothetical protein OEZ86_005888 [Tetradesmus obliquus]